MMDTAFIITALKEVIKAVPFTLVLTFAPLIIGFLISLVVTVIRIKKIKFLEPIANFYVSFFRGTPAIMHIMIIYFGLPVVLGKLFLYLGLVDNTNAIPVYTFVIVALAFTAGSYFSEIIRSGISSIAIGQIEAASSIGMAPSMLLKRIILPQAIANSIPNITNLVVGFLHTTSIAFLVSQKEITGAANIIAAQNFKYLEAFIAAAIIYWGITLVIEFASKIIEKRFKKYERAIV